MENKPEFCPNPEFKLMEQMREVLLRYHYAGRAEQAYCQRIMHFIYFLNPLSGAPQGGAVKTRKRFYSAIMQ